MNNTTSSSQVVEAEPIWLQVAQLSAGFHHMEHLARELVELDGVHQDLLHTQAMIRRDVANAVLNTAMELRKRRSEVVPDEAPGSAVLPKSDKQPQGDEWANRLVRWADQFGRDLFRLPNRLIASNKPKDDGTPRPDKFE